jgi:aryl-alcohol dehydrogenase-like predicted oxidoreductase
MQYRTLGRTGVQVSTLALGAMNFGELGRTTQDEVTAIVDTALDAGINLIDTADIYSDGESEEMVGKAIAGRREDIVLATKAGLPMGEKRDHRGSSRRWLVTELDNSLRRLGVDHVDLYQIHRWDPSTSDEETLSALTDLQRAGKIRYFAPRPSPPTASCKRSGPPASITWVVTSPSSPATRSCSAGPRPMCCP